MLEEEWVVYSSTHPAVKDKQVNAVSKRQWIQWMQGHKLMNAQYQLRLIAVGLTEQQAKQFANLTKESTK